jgi:hypothetical protein
MKEVEYMIQPEFLTAFARAWLTNDALERCRSLEQCWAGDGRVRLIITFNGPPPALD